MDARLVNDLGLDKVEKAYSSPPWWYDLRGIGLVFATYRSNPLAQISFFERCMGKSHLDVPVGTGTVLRLSLLYRRLKGKPTPAVAGIDYSSVMLNGARKALKRFPTVRLSQGDVAHLPFDAETFDSANVANGFHCFPDPNAALKEIHRVLKRRGRVAANVLLPPRGNRWRKRVAERINAWAMKKGMLRRPMSRNESIALFRANGFEIARATIRGNTLYLVATKGAGARDNWRNVTSDSEGVEERTR